MYKISYAHLWVHDQDEALAFYTGKLGMELRADVTLPELGGFRWVVVGAPGQPDVGITLMAIPGPPMMDDATAEQMRGLIAKGVLGPGAFDTDDCAGDYARLSERGVTFLSEPTDRPYGIEATLRDNSGNWFSMTQRPRTPA
jgi:catechol 2,3-dioxygenase-like lactoylglutathione lyase family enzyme